MTQKELAYVEDAIGHEENIIKICNESIKNLEDDTLKEFLLSLNNFNILPKRVSREFGNLVKIF